jgi:hypothetical protein
MARHNLIARVDVIGWLAATETYDEREPDRTMAGGAGGPFHAIWPDHPWRLTRIVVAMVAGRLAKGRRLDGHQTVAGSPAMTIRRTVAAARRWMIDLATRHQALA